MENGPSNGVVAILLITAILIGVFFIAVLILGSGG